MTQRDEERALRKLAPSSPLSRLPGTQTRNRETGRVLDDAGSVRDPTGVVAAVVGRGALNGEDTREGRVGAYLNVAGPCVRLVQRPDRLIVQEPGEGKILIALTRRAHYLRGITLRHSGEEERGDARRYYNYY